MSRRCTVCAHPKRKAIESAHLSGRAFRRIARDFAASEDAVERHLKAHFPLRLAKAAEKREMADGADLIQRLLDLNRETTEILAEARRQRKPYLALRAIARAEAQLELQARLAGEIRDRQVNIVNVQLDPETAERMARLYLERRARSADLLNPISAEVMP